MSFSTEKLEPCRSNVSVVVVVIMFIIIKFIIIIMFMLFMDVKLNVFYILRCDCMYIRMSYYDVKTSFQKFKKSLTLFDGY